MKIGVMSDSHHKSDVANSAISLLQEKKVDLIIHAGDIVELDTLKALKRSKIPYAAVFGNNDNGLKEFSKDYEIFNEPKILNFRGLKLKIMHYPHYISTDTNIVIYGHTHYFTAVFVKNSLILNPGEICGRKKPLYEFAIIEILNFNSEKQNSENFTNLNAENFKILKFQSEILKTPIWQEIEVKL